MNTLPRLLPRLAFAVLAAAVAPLHAADTPEPAPAPARADPLDPARAAITGLRWQAAIDALRRANLTGSADWNNLMGYALRKQTPPDLDGAQRHYDAALRIDPRHLGALEYAGELALMKGQLAEAESRLAALARVCSTPCDEQEELKKAIERFKANGNRYQ